jgi:hypothetical protein
VVGRQPFRKQHHPFEMVLILRTTQFACANLVDFDMQRNGGGGHEKDLDRKFECRAGPQYRHLMGPAFFGNFGIQI